MKRTTPVQFVFLLALSLAYLALWIMPSDVVALVARDRHTLLGRYSRTHFAWIIGMTVITALVFFVHFARDAAAKKRRAFRVIAGVVGGALAVLAIDVGLCLTTPYTYVLGKLVYHRPPGAQWHETFEDVPRAIRTYPHAPPGYGTVECTFHVDCRGFRNPTCEDRYDVVVIGDSFAEGSSVSDEHVFSVKLAEFSGLSTYNISVSGYAPQNYLAVLREYGVALQPQYVLLMLYEGNDFRTARITARQPSQWSRFFKRSPLVQSLDEFLIRTLGPIGAKRHLVGLDVLSWMPIAIGEAPNARHYAFPPSFLVNHYTSRERFETGKHWKRTEHNLLEMQRVCAEAGIDFVIVYLPTKPHVVLPLARDRLSADKLHAFTAFRYKKKLPPPAEFFDNLFDYLDVQETVVRDWCSTNEIRFISLTEPLRDATGRGEPVFYSYDAHWSPRGHTQAAEVVAQRITRYSN